MIVRVHCQVRSASVFVDKEDPLPGFAAIGCSKDPSLRLRSVAVTDSRDKHDVRIVWIDYDAGDSTRLVETRVGPCLAAVSGFVDAIADRDVAANEALARASPDDVVVRWRYG